MEVNRAYSVDDELMHYAKGQRARNHKYVAIRNGRYIYPDDVSGAYQGITEAARRGMNTVDSIQKRAGEGLNSFLNGVNDNRHEKEAARQQRIQNALDEATKKAEARKKKKQQEEKDALESIMDPFRRAENIRKSAQKRAARNFKNRIEYPIGKELHRQKKVHNQLKKERQEKITNVKNTLDNLPSTVKQTAKNELDWWRSPTRQKGQQAIQKISASDFIAENERRARQAAAKRNNSSQRSSAVKEKSSSAHHRATSSAQAKKRSAAKNKQRIANAKASRAR